MIKPTLIAALASCVAIPAFADISVRFIEGAPKDRFVIASQSGLCSEGPVNVVIDLTGSAGALIFDVTSSGAGIEVYQPFELVSGGDLIAQTPKVVDGDKAVTLELTGFAAGSELAFTIDVDDTVNSREITVTGSEIVGATVIVTSDRFEGSATFDDTAKASLATDACT